jgi:hypothetical protein
MLFDQSRTIWKKTNLGSAAIVVTRRSADAAGHACASGDAFSSIHRISTVP